MDRAELRSRCEGCLLGLAIGDALGAKFEGQTPEAIRARFPDAQSLIDYPTEEIWYTDDTQMAIGVAEALLADGEILEQTLCNAFVTNYLPSRGYGYGARKVLDAMELGKDYRDIAENFFPGGSFGNGAAMRVAPVGLVFYQDHERLWEQARLSALPTHVHPLGIEGAQLLAKAVASVLQGFDRNSYFQSLIDLSNSEEFRARLTLAKSIDEVERLPELGNGIAALESVVTAITCFAQTPESFESVITNAIFLGGDTDTIAAMAGAISGAHLGVERLPSRLLELLESSPKGADYIRQLAQRLSQMIPLP